MTSLLAQGEITDASEPVPVLEPDLSVFEAWYQHLDLEALLQFFGVFGLVAIVLFIGHRQLTRAEASERFGRQLTMVLLTLAGIIAIVLALPVQNVELIQALLGLIGIVLSAVLALSSTTLMGNALGGLMLRGLRNFRTGDFIRCGEHFGRVTERGLVHTEIQTEDSDLTTLPNLFLVSNPLTTVRNSGTIVSATVSLGYDVPRHKIEESLLRAATRSELTAPFVQILDLGDYSVVYRIAGLLKDVKQILSFRSNLRGLMLDELHEAGIEIVSPTFMNQRTIKHEFIPEEQQAPAPSRPQVRTPEDIVFEKAESAQTIEVLQEEIVALDKEIEDYKKLIKAASDEEQERLEKRLAGKQARQENLRHVIEAYEARREE